MRGRLRAPVRNPSGMSYHPDEPDDVYKPGLPRRTSKRNVRSRLRDRDLERPNRPNGIKLSDGAVELIAIIGALEGYRRAERIRALVHFKAPEREELRAAVVALWRMKRLDAVREMVEHAGFGAGRDRLPTIDP